ncbi:2-C-methyl-D-erythritol 4-phosphate cytidylyltransferase [Verrucomicrobiota bacterium]
MNSGIIVAAGRGLRVGKNVDKAFLSLGSKPVLVYSLLAFEKCRDIEEVILAVRRERIESARCVVQMFGCTKVRKIVGGGAQRHVSVAKGLAEISDDTTIVAVHDGARPCVTPELISETIKAAKKYGSGVAAIKITDTVKEAQHGMVISDTIDREKLWMAQTPQAFKLDLLLKGIKAASRKRLTVTDEASAVELVSDAVRLVQSSPSNIKITTPDDLVLAAALMRL